MPQILEGTVKKSVATGWLMTNFASLLLSASEAAKATTLISKKKGTKQT